MSGPNRRELRVNVLLVVMSIIFTYSILEIGYRIYKYVSLHRPQTTEFPFITGESPLYRFDKATGFSYIPDTRIWRIRFDGSNHQLPSNWVKVNNLGLLSRFDDDLNKSPSEYRIAFIGDSFTADLYNDVIWTDLLQEQLNQDEALKSRLHVSTFTVMNFGLDSIGVVQFDSVFRNRVLAAQPDMVIVNFITDDIRRQFIWRDLPQGDTPGSDFTVTLFCVSLPISIDNPDCGIIDYLALDASLSSQPTQLARIKQEIVDWQIRHMPWFSPNPFLLARILGGYLRINPALELHLDRLRYFASDDEALNRSLNALADIANHASNVVIVNIPVLEELLSHKAGDLSLELMAKGSNLPIVKVADYLPAQADETTERSWYNIYDGHFSNDGAEIFSHIMKQVIIEHLEK